MIKRRAILLIASLNLILFLDFESYKLNDFD